MLRVFPTIWCVGSQYHPEGYTATDILSRFKRAQGYNVLHPMGGMLFGLPVIRNGYGK